MVLVKLFFNFSIIIIFTVMQVELKDIYSFEIHGEAYGGYYISLDIGTPSQTTNVLLDSGSSNFAVAVNPNEVNRAFRYKDSSSFSSSDKTVTIHYTEGSWSGFFATDNITLCPKPFCTLTMQFACITSSSMVFENTTNWIGILGLAYPSVAKPEKYVKSFMESLILNNIPNIFSLSLCGPFVCTTKNIPGQMLFGGIDPVLYNGDIVYTPVVKEWFYEVIITGLQVGNETFDGPCLLFNDRSIVDTGSTFLSFPEEIHAWVIQKIKQATGSLSFSEQFWTQQATECLNNTSAYTLFPSLTLSFYHTTSSSFSLNIIPELYLLKFPSQLNEMCLKLAISAIKKSTVIGATVLKGFYVVFDRQNKQIGFANSTCENCAILSNYNPIVFKPAYGDKNFSDCKKAVSYAVNNLYSYIALAVSLVCSMALLLLLSSWLHHKSKRRNRSDQSSLAYNVLS